MKKRILLVITCLSCVILLAAASQPKQLIHNETGFVVIEKKNGKILIHDPILEHNLHDFGIAIPGEDRASYHNKEKVMPEDEEFWSAFKNHYAKSTLNPNAYHWS